MNKDQRLQGSIMQTIELPEERFGMAGDQESLKFKVGVPRHVVVKYLACNVISGKVKEAMW